MRARTDYALLMGNRGYMRDMGGQYLEWGRGTIDAGLTLAAGLPAKRDIVFIMHISQDCLRNNHYDDANPGYSTPPMV